MRIGVKSFVIIAAAILLLVAGYARAVTPAQELFIKAESTQDPSEAIEHWRALLPEAEKGTLGEGVSRDDIQTNLIQSLIKRAEKTSKIMDLQEAQQNAAQLKDSVRRAWANIAIARSFAVLNDMNHGLAILDKEFVFAQAQPEEQKNLIISGIIKTLSSPKGKSDWLFGQDGVNKAKQMAMQLKDPASFASVMQASAGAQTAQEGIAADDEPALIAQAEKALDEKNYPQALQAAMALPLDTKEKRNTLLLRITGETLASDDWTITVQALRSVMDTMEQSDAMLKVVKTLLENKEITRAENLAAWIPDGRRASQAYGLLAAAYKQLGYNQRLGDMLSKADRAIKKITDDKRRDEANGDLAKILADMDEVSRAEAIVQDMGSQEEAYEANAALAKKLAYSNLLDKAKEHFNAIDDAPVNLRIPPAAAIAKRLADNGEPYKAQDIIDDADYKGELIDVARLAIVKALAKAGEFDDADEAVKKIADPAVVGKGNTVIATWQAKKGDKQEGLLQLGKVLQASAGLPEDGRYKLQEFIARNYTALGNSDEAKAILAKIPPAYQKNAIFYLATQEIQQDKIGEALKNIHTLTGTDAFDWVASRAAIQMAVRNHIEEAVRLTKSMTGIIDRVLTFHKIAIIQSKHTDFYGVLGKKEDALAQSEIQPSSITGGQLTKKDIDATEKKLHELIKSKDTDLVAMEVGDSPLGRKIPAMDTGKLTANHLDVEKRLPVARAGSVKRLLAQSSVFNSKIVDASGFSKFILSQKTFVPQIIFVESGVLDLATIHDQLALEGADDFIIKKGREYLLRKPIVVGPKATLVISGADVDELKLSEEGGAYIINSGNLYIADTKVTAWSEKEGRPSWRKYEEKKIFRPFINSWSESKTYFSKAIFTALGYSNSKSYGISLSSGPKEYIRYRYDRLARPEAVIVDSSFNNLLYGFYSYEADNVVLVGNEFINNTTYGIDPHDRSRFFTIAYNTSYNAEKKHGIIISREVNDSTILGNISFDNNGSGIMVDRQSSGTLIYANTAFDNKGDGLTIFESSCKIIASNQFFDNGRSGVRVRNSLDIGVYFNFIRNNHSAAINGYVADLRNDPAHGHRDFELDPYSDVTALSVVGNWIEKNGTGIFTDGMSALFLRKNQFVNQSPRLFRGNWSSDLPHMITRHNIDVNGLLVTSRCPHGTLLPYHCPFREDGLFNGDGQSDLPSRVREGVCQGSVASNE